MLTGSQVTDSVNGVLGNGASEYEDLLSFAKVIKQQRGLLLEMQLAGLKNSQFRHLLIKKSIPKQFFTHDRS